MYIARVHLANRIHGFSPPQERDERREKGRGKRVGERDGGRGQQGEENDICLSARNMIVSFGISPLHQSAHETPVPLAERIQNNTYSN